LALKGVWQVARFKENGYNAIIFLDEPYLSSYGSCYVNLSRTEIIDILNEVIFSIKEEGAKVGIHCCGNTDWGILADTEVDIISFDAFNYLDTLILYSNKILKFTSKGGYLCWGIVPTTDESWKLTYQDILERFQDGVGKLGKSGNKEEIILQSFFTPSCGTGSLDPQLSQRILKLTYEVASKAKDIFGI
jgi:hypothetical protein